MIYLITVNYYSAELIAKLLASIHQGQAQVDVDYQLIVVNNSAAEDCSKLASDRVLILEAGENLGFGGGCNLGLNWVFERDRAATAWLINPDTTLSENSLNHAAQFCKIHPMLSIIGTIISEPSGKIWFAGGEFVPETGKIIAKTESPHQLANYVETSWVTGCSLLVNFQNFNHCPQFDPAYFLYYEDFDFCRRYAQQGHRIVITEQIQVVHQPSSITNRTPSLTLQHSTFSYLLALERHTSQKVFGYRLSRILFHALRASVVQPKRAIAILKGVLNFWQGKLVRQIRQK
ncbi:glycosyltransferase family 2 protein [Phormidium sp. CLA17]|uniref:glycosyltransferase family 2 protein n=1 Tax=Leptolyngbya sp. Cla-17 TaxID=2803751 RepID=UPI00149275F7|nr:glycosyltransferase family 2 protein [Leptolyngbya sp. Cla-17]MBM0742409.1 glycosyltransferase family 2 protein [Leptolyngbya sp. Cla-17]